MITTKLVDFLKESVQHGQKLLVYMNLETGTEESFSVEVMRGQSCHGWRDEYWYWLESLNLDVESVSSVTEDTCGNKNLLCIKCKPMRVF